MKIKTFILTFLMMSCPFLFGQHWVDPDLGSDNGMPITATIHLDGSQQTSSYQVAAFYKSTLLEVQTITAIEIPENYGGGSLYHVDMNIPNFDAGESMNGIYFKFFDGTNEYVSVEKVNYNEDGLGIHTDPYEINFKTVAQIEGTEFDVVYPTLQKAIDAAANDDVVTLLKDNAENVTVVQAPDVAFTIDGAGKTMSGTITVNGKSQAYATAGLTIKNVNFDATNISKDASINLGGNNNTRYTNGVTVENCDFTGDWLTTGEEKGAIKNYTGGCKNLKINNCTASSLHSLAQLKGVENLAVSRVTVSDCKNGVSVGTSTNVAISDSNITATGYGVRADGGAYTMTLTNNNISAELPVVVRKAEEFAYNLTVAGDNNTFTAKQQGNNPEGYQVVFTTGDDGTYLAPTTGQFVLSVPENFNVYPVYVAQVGNLKYTSVDAALTAAQPGDVVQIFAGTYNQALNINKAITVEGETDANGNNLVTVQRLNVSGTGATIKNLNANNTSERAMSVSGGNILIENCKLTGVHGLRYCYANNGDVTIKDCIIEGSTYGVHFDAGNGDGDVVIEGCTIKGWTSFGGAIEEVRISNTEFLNGNYNQLRFYQDATVENVIFPAGMRIDTGNGGTGMEGIEVKFNECSIVGGDLEDAFPDSVIAKSDIYVDNVLLKREAKIGETYYATLAEALEAVEGMSGEVTINLLSDATLDITAWQALAIGGETTTKIIIDGENGGNDFTLTFNKLNSDWNHVATNNNATLVLKNMTITDSGYNNGPWNRYDLNFACNTELVNVNATKALAFKAGATLNNVEINEDGDNYAIWIQANGQNVAINGLVINSEGRGIKVDEQYVTAQNVNLSVANATFTTAKKAAIMVKSAANTVITVGENVNISGVSADQTNIAWVDEDAAAHYGKVTVTGGTLGQESMPSFVAALMNGEKVDGYYKTLPEAITAQTGSEIVKVLKDAIGAGAKINKNITIDFNGKTCTFNEGVGSTGTESNGLQILNGNTVALKNGTLNVAETAKADFYILVQNYANLTVDGMKLDGTNLDKWSATDGDSYVLSNNSGTVEIKGATEIIANDQGDKAFAFDVCKYANYADPVVNVTGAEVKVNGAIEVHQDIPNNLNISAGTFTKEIKEAWCANGFIPKDNGDGTWTVKEGQYVARIGETGYETVDAAFKAAQNGNEVKILAAGTYAVPTGKNITITGEVEDVKFDMSNAVGINSSMTFKNVTFEYGNANYKGLQHAGTMVYNNCTINGQVFLYGTSETFNNCTFNQNSADAYNVCTYGANEVAFNECTFNSAGKSVLIYAEGASIFNNVNVTKCTFNASAPVDGKAAIEMDSSLTAGINLTIDGATTTTGFGSGNVSGNSLWNNKKDNETEANNDIKVVVNNETVLAPLPLVAMTADDKNHRFTSLQAAVNAADATNNTITLINNVQLNAYVTINKSVTLDLGEYNITRENGTALYVNGESIEVTIDGEGTVSGTQAVYVDNGIVAIDGGNYVGNFEAVYVKGTGHVVINDGTFSGENENKNFILNKFDGDRATTDITVKGGTFVGFNPQNNAAEGANTDFCHADYAATETETGVWAVLPAVAKIGETRFATLQDAVNASNATNNTITLIDNVQLNAYVTINKSVTLNLGEYNITREDGTALYVNGADIEVTIDGEGTVSGTQAVYVDNGTVTIDGGNYVGHHAVYVINNGHAVINDGTFKLKEGADPNFLLNEYDATRDVTTIAVKGGTFVGFNPQNNAAEGANTNFCAEGYAATETETGVWAVLPVVAKIGEATYATVQDAINVATATDVIDVVGTTTEENITIADNADITLTFAENVTLNGYFAPFEGNLTINGGTINNTNSGASAIEINAGELNLNGVNIASARHAVRIDGAVTATINGGEYTLTATSGTRHAVNVSGGAEVTIEAGTFVGPKGTTMDSGSAVNVQSGAKVTIEGGNYSGGKNNTLASAGILVVTGGTFDQDPSAYVTTPYVVIKKSDNEYNVIKGVAKIGETYYASLQEAIDNVANEQTINLLVACAENVSIDQTEGVSFTIDGQIAENTKVQYTGTISINGNGGYDRAETLTIKNINFNNVSTTALTYISAKETQSHNVTIESCVFDGNGNTLAKGIQVSEGNNWTVKGCTVNNNYNIFIDYAGAYNKMMNKNLLVDGCTINAKQGVLLGRFSNNCTIQNTSFNCATLGINVASRVGTTEGEVLSHTLNNVNFTGKAISCSYPTNAPAHTHIFNIVGEVTSASELSFPDQINAGGRLNFVLTATDATLQAKGQDNLTVNVSEELAAQHYEVVYDYDVDTYKAVKEQNVKNTTKGETYPTLTEAIAAASAGNELVLLKDITENVTINKNLTIDGGDNNYTGTMTGNAGLNVTVQNLNFVNAWFDKSSKSTTGTYIFKNCSFDGYNATQNYAFRFKGANSVTIENCTVKDYLYSFLYVTSSTATVNIKDVTVEDCPSYGVYFSSGVTNTSIENLTVKNSNNGFVINNTANRTLNLKNCTFENVTTAINHTNGTNTVKCNLSGENDFGTSALSEYATIVLEAADAKLTAKEGLNNVTTTVEGCVVKYEAGETPGFGTYSVVAANVELVRGETSVGKFATIQDAIDAAQENDKIVVLKDVDLSTNECVLLDNSYNTYFKVEGKTVTVDLNGMTISGEYASSPMLVGVFSTDNNGHLTLEDSSDEKTGAVNVTTAEGYTVYSLIANYEPGCSITINDGTYTLDKAHDSHIYSGSTNGETEGVTVNGGVFKLGNVGTGTNGKPWMFNVLGSNNGNVVVKGGTFDADINHQFWANEVYVPETLALKNNGNNTWTVVESVAYAVEKATSTNASARNVGYATLAEAVNPLGNTVNNTVTVIKSHELTETVIVNKDVEFEFTNDVQVTAPAYSYENGVHTNPTAFRIVDSATVTVNSFNITSGVNGLYNFILGAADGETAGNLVINNGTFVANTSVVSVTKGNLVIKGGDFSLVEGTTDYRYLINCIDANYNNETATVAISGGTFHNWNPQNNAAEGANTNFCAEGYGAVETAASSNVWEVMPVQKQNLVKGWNWYSSYLNVEITDLTTALGANAIQIKGQTQSEGYMDYVPDWGWTGPMTTIDFAKMYMINTTEACEMKLAAELLNPEDYKIVVNPGWSWIGYPSNQGVSVSVAFKNLTPEEGDIIKTRNSGHAEFAWGMWVGTLKTMVPGEGYMYRNTDGTTAKEFYYNFDTDSRDVAEANITAENNYWTPNVAEYPFNMTITAVLDGEMMNDNYEIAAFVNGEVRGSARPIYIEPLDAYMFFLTIHGNDVEEMTFKCYDLTSGEEYMLDNRVNYSNDAIVGSVNEPYVFSRGTMGIGEASLSEINIYPNPTTTGTEINLQATCDKVEVFNALGVKVAEYQNVDSIDAFETAGIYVIRLTNNGDVKHCKLTVR